MSMTTELEVTGIALRQRLHSQPTFATDTERMKPSSREPYILLTDRRIVSGAGSRAVLEQMHRPQAPADHREDIREGSALPPWCVNHCAVCQWAAVKAPASVDPPQGPMLETSPFSQCQLITRTPVSKLENTKLEMSHCHAAITINKRQPHQSCRWQNEVAVKARSKQIRKGRSTKPDSTSTREVQGTPGQALRCVAV